MLESVYLIEANLSEGAYTASIAALGVEGHFKGAYGAGYFGQEVIEPFGSGAQKRLPTEHRLSSILSRAFLKPIVRFLPSKIGTSMVGCSRQG